MSNYDKVRIISLYVMIKNGISEENLTKLFTHAQLSTKDQDMVRNLSYLGINVIADVSWKDTETRVHSSNDHNMFISIVSEEDLLGAAQRAHHWEHLPDVPLDASNQGHYGGLYWG